MGHALQRWQRQWRSQPPRCVFQCLGIFNLAEKTGPEAGK
jgi:hypothetical protein